MRGPPSMNCCVKLLTEFHMHRAHQTAWRTRQCQGGGGGFLLPFCVSGLEKWGRYPCHARNGAESHRSFVPFPRVPRRRVLRSVERGVRSPMPRRPRATTTLPLTRPPISPYPREFPLPAGHAESVTVRWAMPADHHEALPSLLYLCDGLRRRRFMWCLHSVLCRSFFLPSSLFLFFASPFSEVRLSHDNLDCVATP